MRRSGKGPFMQILKRGCGCKPVQLDRVERRSWMRLLPGIRAYQCQICGERFLAAKRLIVEMTIAHRRAEYEQRLPDSMLHAGQSRPTSDHPSGAPHMRQ